MKLLVHNNGLIKAEIPENDMQEKCFFVERNKFAKIYEQYLNKDSVCVDIGACIGVHSLYMGLYTDNFIYAYEPNKLAYDILKKNTDKHDNISCFNQAIGNGLTAKYIFKDENNIGQSKLNNDDLEYLNADGLEYETQRFDEKIKGFESLDFVKIDVEGYELEVLKGMQEILKTYKPTILIEIHYWSRILPNGEEEKINYEKECFEILKKLGYKKVYKDNNDYIFENEQN